MTQESNGQAVEVHETLPAIREERDTAVAMPTTFDDLLEIGNKLIATQFLPPTITTPAQFAAVVMTGQELGLATMQSLRLLQPIENRDKTGHQVSLKPEGMLALWRSKYGGRHQWLHSDDKKAVLKLISKAGDTHTETFTVEDANALWLISDKQGSAWNRQRATMLRWRCVSKAFRFFAPEVIGGLRIEDEVEHWESSDDEIDASMRRDEEIAHRDRHQTLGAKGEVASGLEPKSPAQKKIFNRWIGRDCWDSDQRKAWIERAEAPEMGFHAFAKLIQELEAATNLKMTEAAQEGDQPVITPPPAAVPADGAQTREDGPGAPNGAEEVVVEGERCQHGVPRDVTCQECELDQGQLDV